MLRMTPQRRSVRLTRLQELFRSTRHGYTARELADTTGMHIRSIQRDLLVMQSEMGMPLHEEDGRYSLMRELMPAVAEINEETEITIELVEHRELKATAPRALPFAAKKSV